MNVEQMAQAIQEVLKRQGSKDDGLTAAEIVGMTGKSIAAVRRALGALAGAGMLSVTEGIRVNVSGRRSSVPVYSLKPRGVNHASATEWPVR